MIRRNWSSRALDLSGGDAIIVSIPKSGRTWVRTFLCAYFCKLHDRVFTLEPQHDSVPAVPRIVYSHDLFEHCTKGSRWDYMRGKYLIPRRELARAKIVLLARDPRDAFVSLHVQLTRRTRETPLELQQKTVGALLRDPNFGICSMVKIMNGWLAEFSERPEFSLLRYEALRVQPRAEFCRLLCGLGETPPDEQSLNHAVAFADFGNMKRLEAAGAFDSKILRAGDIADPESFKVRRGTVGGYRDYLSPADLDFAAREMKKLDPRFGY